MLKHSLMAMAALGMITLSAVAGDQVVNINKDLNNADRIAKEDLGNKDKVYDETALLLNKAEDVALPEVKFDAPAPGSGVRYERAFVNAPPMIPHSVEGLLPITKANNACLSCHMPDVAAAAKATPIPASHFTNFRPDTALKDGKVIKEGKELGANNTSDVVIAKAKKLKTLYQGRYNCSQCHAPQANIDTAVDNTFQADFGDGSLKSKSNLIDVMNAGVE